MLSKPGRSDKEEQLKPSRTSADRPRRSRMMGFGLGSNLQRDWLLGALQEVLRLRARVAEHYREQIYDRLSDVERESERLDGIGPGETETRDKRPRRGRRLATDLLHTRWGEARRYAVQWWEDHLRFRARQIDSYIELLHTRNDRLRELRETNRGDVEREAPKAKVPVTPDATE